MKVVHAKIAIQVDRHRYSFTTENGNQGHVPVITINPHVPSMIIVRMRPEESFVRRSEKYV